MTNLINGIHHITAIAGDPQKNLDFYSGILGLRFLKKTVNFDAPQVYHLYYGDEQGLPGSILTFFPYGAGIRQGKQGKGMMNTVTFSVHASSFDYWEKRLLKYNIAFTQTQNRFDSENVLYFEDHDGLGLALVFNEKDIRHGFTYGHIPIEYSLKGFYSAELWEDNKNMTAALLTGQMNHELIAEKDNWFRFAPFDKPGSYIDIYETPKSDFGTGGNGTFHHIAFSTPNDESQSTIRDLISQGFFNPTPVIDRQYFHSVYFREPGGVLFEIATDMPGFSVDEALAHLGETLKLPPQYEPERINIENLLPKISLNWEKYQ